MNATSVPDEAPVETLPEGLPVSDDDELLFDASLSAESDAEHEAGAKTDAALAALPTRTPSSFEEEPTRKQHAPKAPRDVLKDVDDLRELFKSWDEN